MLEGVLVDAERMPLKGSRSLRRGNQTTGSQPTDAMISSRHKRYPHGFDMLRFLQLDPLLIIPVLLLDEPFAHFPLCSSLSDTQRPRDLEQRPACPQDQRTNQEYNAHCLPAMQDDISQLQ